ncbi:class I SAM-dependent methyltransferase [Balneolaceae bacterium YR4-1]|uniref:Class I SAM-dependent methyltransferase n=1 Tax=Halalkalibaculum roseum TaxID=2709311 RepID=A0A6M1SSV9_9BACT|nr:class I SAM-dependent methyltransferase [Halalkalibaculum roseum]NGP75960.1 class I SAM-dependent methyltransferase [Halalkalibaculum roseum]
MSRIAYDPVKDRFASLIRNSAFLRTLFYKLLDLFFLRSWYVRRVLRTYAGDMDRKGPWQLLDAGSGFGQYDRFILHHFENVRVTAVDVKEDYLEDSRSYFEAMNQSDRIRFEQMDLLDPGFDRVYDFVICIDVLEHIEEDRKVITNLQSTLKEGGYLLMHSPSIYAEEDAEGDETFVDEHARVGYSKEDIREKLQTAGLEPVEVEYTYGEKGHRAWELLIKYPMLWMNRYKLWVLPLLVIYFLFTLPYGLTLMKLDMRQKNERGTGIYALARK